MEVGIRKTILLVLDSVGVGSQPDAYHYGDRTANTLSHVADYTDGIHIPNLTKMGLANLTYVKGADRQENTTSFYGKMRARSDGKDSSTGHFELMGLALQEESYQRFSEGLPEILLDEINKLTGLQFIGNKVLGEDQIIDEYAPQHRNSGKPIIFTGSDSYIKIAYHVDVIDPDMMFQYGLMTRHLLYEFKVSRMILVPFSGDVGEFIKVEDRREEFTLPPPGQTLLNALEARGIPVYALGKVNSLFHGEGIKESFVEDGNNTEVCQEILRLLRDCETNEKNQAFIFANCKDFDSLHGHNRNPRGYAESIEEFDTMLPRIFRTMENEDLLLVTADHGNDPTFDGFDHTREHIPLLVYSRMFRPQGRAELGVRKTYADVAETISDAYDLNAHFAADSFWEHLLAHL